MGDKLEHGPSDKPKHGCGMKRGAQGKEQAEVDTVSKRKKGET